MMKMSKRVVNRSNGSPRIVLNLLREPVVAYTIEGEMIKLFPIDEVTEPPDNIVGKIAYLVSDDYYNNLTAEEKWRKEYVHITSQGVGRDGVEIATFSTFGLGDNYKVVRVLPAYKSDYERVNPRNYTFLKI